MVGVSDPTADLAESVKAAVMEIMRAAAHAASPGADQTHDDATAGDSEDIRRTREGDSDAYRRLVERYQDHVAQILWRFSRERSVHEELVQDVFVEAYLSLNTYHGRAPLGHWLARIATRVGYRYWKEKARRKAVEPFSLAEWDQVASDEEMIDRIEPDRAADILHRLLAQLPPRDRLVLTMRYIEECDVAETARRTGWTKTMVKVQALRARNKLKKLLERSELELI